MRSGLVVALLLGTACVTAKPRQIPPAARETVAVSATVAFEAAVRAVTNLGLPVRQADQDARMVETHYVDLASFRPELVSQYPEAERAVRYRIVVVPNAEGPGSSVGFFAVYIPFRMGFSTSERSERAIPPDHPGMELVQRMAKDVREAAKGGR